MIQLKKVGDYNKELIYVNPTAYHFSLSQESGLMVRFPRMLNKKSDVLNCIIQSSQLLLHFLKCIIIFVNFLLAFSRVKV